MIALIALNALGAVLAVASLRAWRGATAKARLADAAWPALVAALAMLDARFGGGDVYRRAAVASMMGSWGLRLSIYALYGGASRPLFRPFHPHAVSALFCSLPAVFAASNPAPEFSIVELVAAGIW